MTLVELYDTLGDLLKTRPSLALSSVVVGEDPDSTHFDIVAVDPLAGESPMVWLTIYAEQGEDEPDPGLVGP